MNDIKLNGKVIYANFKESNRSKDQNGNEFVDFSYDQIEFYEDKIVKIKNNKVEKMDLENFKSFEKIIEADSKVLDENKDIIDAFIEEQKEKEAIAKKKAEELAKLEKSKADRISKEQEKHAAKISKIEEKHKVKNLKVNKKQPKKTTVSRKQVLLVIAGGAIVLASIFGYNPATKIFNNLINQTNGDTIDQSQQQLSPLEQLNIDFDNAVLVAKSKFEANRLVVDEKDINTYVYLLNYNTIGTIDDKNTIAIDLQNSNLLSSNANDNFEAFERVMGTIINHNGTTAKNNKKSELSTFEDKLINQSDMLIDVNYKSFVANLETTIYNIIHTTDKTVRENSIKEANSLIVGTKTYSGINFEMLPSAIKVVTSSELINRFIGFTGELGMNEYLSLQFIAPNERAEGYQNITDALNDSGICLVEKNK